MPPLKFNLSSTLFLCLIITALVVFRIFMGIQINFAHEDYIQIYLMGLENAVSNEWSYWGPDVVWSATRLPGALQGLLVGIPLRICEHPYSPIILSNLISSAGLLFLAFYIKKRFKELPLLFIAPLLLLLPFFMHHGTVILNTSYLIFSGSIFFISVFELFNYRDRLLIKNPAIYFVSMGFALLFTYQLHLTWVTLLPFIIVLFGLEFKNNRHNFIKTSLYFTGGCLLGSIFVLPTLFNFYHVVFAGTSGNLAFKPERFLSILDLFSRYFTYATYDLNPEFDHYGLASEKSTLTYYLLNSVKYLGIIQAIAIWLIFIKEWQNKILQKTLLLFTLTLFMSLILYVISNKHLESRTYILLFPIPVFLTFFSYQVFFKYKTIRTLLYTSLAFVFITFCFVIKMNYHDQFSFHSKNGKIIKALEEKDSSVFGKRRKTKMDAYK